MMHGPIHIKLLLQIWISAWAGSVEYFRLEEEQEEGIWIGYSRHFQKNCNACTSPKVPTYCQDGEILFIISVV